MRERERAMQGTFDGWDNELYHHGIKGQKWGVRRFQNPDGTLTAEGRARYFNSDGGMTRAGRKEYARQTKTLNKLADRANAGLQASRAARYSSRAKTAGKIGLAAGLAGGVSMLAGTAGTNELRKVANRNMLNSADWKAGGDYAARVRSLAKDRDLAGAQRASRLADKHYKAALDRKRKTEFNIDQYQSITRITGAALGAGAAISLGYSAVSKIKANAANRRLTDSGHQKAVKAYKNQVDYMLNMFKDVPTTELLNQRRKH